MYNLDISLLKEPCYDAISHAFQILLLAANGTSVILVQETFSVFSCCQEHFIKWWFLGLPKYSKQIENTDNGAGVYSMHQIWNNNIELTPTCTFIQNLV